MLLSWRKSPEGWQLPSSFTTMWSGDTHGESLHLQIPVASISLKYSLAAVSLAGTKRLQGERIGPPVVSILWKNPCLGFPVGIFVQAMPVNSW